MNDDHRQKTIGALCELCDGTPINSILAEDGACLLYALRLSLHFMVQAVIAAPLLADPLLFGEGFFPRCLLCWPASTAGTRAYQAVDLTQDADVQQYISHLETILAVP